MGVAQMMATAMEYKLKEVQAENEIVKTDRDRLAKLLQEAERVARGQSEIHKKVLKELRTETTQSSARLSKQYQLAMVELTKTKAQLVKANEKKEHQLKFARKRAKEIINKAKEAMIVTRAKAQKMLEDYRRLVKKETIINERKNQEIEANIRRNALIGAAREVKQLRATALKEVDAEAQER